MAIEPPEGLAYDATKAKAIAGALQATITSARLAEARTTDILVALAIAMGDIIAGSRLRHDPGPALDRLVLYLRDYLRQRLNP